MARRLALLMVIAAVITANPAHAVPLALQPLKNTVGRYGLQVDLGPDAFPDDDIVVILRRIQKTIHNTGEIEIEEHQIFKVLRGRGEGVSTQRLFAPPDGKLEIVARTISPTGEIVSVAGSDIHRERVQSKDPLAQASELVSFAFPAIEPGAILEYRYQMYDAQPLTADLHLFDGPYPTQVSQFVLGMPSERRFNIRSESGRAPGSVKLGKAQVTLPNGRQIELHTYELRDIPAVPHEPFAHADLNLRSHLLLVSGVGDGLSDSGKLWRRLAVGLMSVQEGPRHSLEYPRALALKATRTLKRPEDKARAIVDELAKHVRIEHHRSLSDRARTLEEVFESGLAEPLEFARILVTMLRSVSVPAYFAIVNSANSLELDERVPWQGFFDRWLIYVQGSDGSLYHDPQSPELLASSPRYDCQGRKMLLARVDAGSGEPRAALVEIPRVAGTVSETSRRVRVRVQDDGPTRLSIEERQSGEMASQLVAMSRRDGISAVRELAARRLVSRLGDADSTRVEVSLSNDHTATVRAELETAALDLRTAAGRAHIPGLIALPAELLTLAATVISERTLAVDLAFPSRIRTTVVVELPSGARAAELPPSRSSVGPGLRFTVATSRTNRGYELVSTVEVLEPIIRFEQVPRLDAFIRELIAAHCEAIQVVR